jgi:RNA polymerase sigma-70 factor (ECF subfamily)
MNPQDAAPDFDSQRKAEFTALWNLLSHRIYRAIVAMIGGNESEAEEIHAETFIRAFKGWQDVARHAEPAAWLLLVARRIWIDRYRARAARGEHYQVPLESVRSEIDEQMPRELALPFDPALATAINKLSPQQREVVACHVLAGLSIRTTADVLNTSTGNVRSQLHVALRRLRDELGDEEEVVR